MRLRGATITDIAAIAELHTVSWQQHYRGDFSDEYLDGPIAQDRLKRWQGRLSAPAENQFVVVAEDENGEIIGFVCAFGADDERWGTLLDNIHVRRELFGRGIGARLIAVVAEWTMNLYPECGMYLLTLETNVRAQRLYERLGGVNVETGPWDSPDGGQVLSRRYYWPPEALGRIASLA